MAAPTAEQVGNYLGEHSWPVEDIQAALDAETAAQGRVCRVPDPMPADLAEALMRRTAANLARRRLLLDGQPSESEFPQVLPGRDPEVRRLEAPWRKLVMG